MPNLNCTLNNIIYIQWYSDIYIDITIETLDIRIVWPVLVADRRKRLWIENILFLTINVDFVVVWMLEPAQ